MIRSFFVAAFCTVVLCLYGQDGVQWVSWEEGIVRSKTEQKKLIVDLYTDWCGWCKKMDKTTFMDPFISEFINDRYIAIKFNAEYKKDIEFEGKVYNFTKGGRRGYHKLAALITSGRLSYPTLVFMDENAKVIQAIPGYQDAPTLEMIITFFEGNYHKTTPWVNYVNDYRSGLIHPDSKHHKDPNNPSKLVGQKKN